MTIDRPSNRLKWELLVHVYARRQRLISSSTSPNTDDDLHKLDMSPSANTNTSTDSSSTVEYFTPSWCRPCRKNDVVISPSTNANNGTTETLSSSLPNPWWRKYTCVCGKPPSTQTTANSNESSSTSHKRCSRCQSAIYCSSECQRQDYTEGDHKANCRALGKLWEEKAWLENCFWESKTKSTNPFDDDVYNYPVVGKFWHDQPQSELQNNTTQYCVVLLQLVQLLGRGESWRVSRIQSDNWVNSRRRGPGNPLSREMAIDISFQLLHLDRMDMRVRLLIPSLLLEGEYYQEAYDFLRHWLQVDTSLMVMNLALMGGSMGDNEEGEKEEKSSPFLSGKNIAESPEQWMDSEMVYPSIGMVFELAFLKCHLSCLLKNDQFQSDGSNGSYRAFGMQEHSGTEPITLAENCAAVGEEELERQVRMLLSVVHKWNPHLLPNLKGAYNVETGSSPNEDVSATKDGVIVPATPPALFTLLDKHPPGFELQFRMGNPGGQSLDEAVSIWQRDMILWHVVDPMAMKFLSEFCSNLEENLVDPSCLNGGVESKSGQSESNGTTGAETQDDTKNVMKRKEAEELVAKLQKENPDQTVDQIMMHPEMALLMIKHFHTG